MVFEISLFILMASRKPDPEWRGEQMAAGTAFQTAHRKFEGNVLMQISNVFQSHQILQNRKNPIMSWEFFIAVAALTGLQIGIHVLEKRKNATRKSTDHEMLFTMARITETSEFEQFRQAAENWNISMQKVEADFKQYLFHSELPYYVRDYLRRAGESAPELLYLRADCQTLLTGTVPQGCMHTGDKSGSD